MSPFPCSKAIEEGGDGCHLLLFQYKAATFFVMLQGKKKGDNIKTDVSSLRYAIAQLHKRKKATTTAIAFFVVLRCNATKQEEEEGNNNIVVVAFFFAPSCIAK
jgi:hypothetical protein